MNPDEIQEFVSQHDVKMIDLKFTDLLGTWQHFSITPRELTPEIYTQGIGFDGSSIRAFQGDALHSESVSHSILAASCGARAGGGSAWCPWTRAPAGGWLPQSIFV